MENLTQIFEFGDYKPRLLNYNQTSTSLAQKAEEQFIVNLNNKAKHILKMEYSATKLRAQNDIVSNQLVMEKADLDLRSKELRKLQLSMKLFEDKEKWIKEETKKLEQKQDNFISLINHV